jgi:hypothetical protein
MEIELRRTAPDDPAALTFARALRDEVEARDAANGAARPNRSLADVVMADAETLVAYAGDRPVGTGALRPYGEVIAEVKRMYVIPAFGAPASPSSSWTPWRNVHAPTASRQSGWTHTSG